MSSDQQPTQDSQQNTAEESLGISNILLGFMNATIGEEIPETEPTNAGIPPSRDFTVSFNRNDIEEIHSTLNDYVDAITTLGETVKELKRGLMGTKRNPGVISLMRSEIDLLHDKIDNLDDNLFEVMDSLRRDKPDRRGRNKKSSLKSDDDEDTDDNEGISKILRSYHKEMSKQKGYSEVSEALEKDEDKDDKASKKALGKKKSVSKDNRSSK